MSLTRTGTSFRCNCPLHPIAAGRRNRALAILCDGRRTCCPRNLTRFGKWKASRHSGDARALPYSGIKLALPKRHSLSTAYAAFASFRHGIYAYHPHAPKHWRYSLEQLPVVNYTLRGLQLDGGTWEKKKNRYPLLVWMRHELSQPTSSASPSPIPIPGIFFFFFFPNPGFFFDMSPTVGCASGRPCARSFRSSRRVVFSPLRAGFSDRLARHQPGSCPITPLCNQFAA